MVVTIWEVRGMQTYNGSGTNNLTGDLLPLRDVMLPEALTRTDDICVLGLSVGGA